jgi:hypothetical protein
MKTFLNEQIHDDDMEDKEAHGMTFYRGQEKGMVFMPLQIRNGQEHFDAKTVVC